MVSALKIDALYFLLSLQIITDYNFILLFNFVADGQASDDPQWEFDESGVQVNDSVADTHGENAQPDGVNIGLNPEQISALNDSNMDVSVGDVTADQAQNGN